MASTVINTAEKAIKARKNRQSVSRSRKPVNNQPKGTELVLYLWEDKLVGHVAAGFSNEQGGYRYGVFAELERE